VKEFESPTRIIILGAGPIGLEATLYARCLGYEVDLIEKGQVADSVRRWGHVTMFTPFRMNRSSLGATAIQTQDASYQLPQDDDLLTGDQWVEHYLLPMARSDLVVDCLQENTAAIAAGRVGVGKSHPLGDDREDCGDFQVLAVASEGQEKQLTASIVIDTTGVFGNPNWLGPGGIPGIGERRMRDRVDYGLPDIRGARRDEFVGRCTMVVGAGYSAATTVVALARLAEESADTKVLWVTRRSTVEPIKRIANDRLTARDALACQANALAADVDSPVQLLSASQVAEIQPADGERSLIVRLEGQAAGEYRIDHLIANVGYRPNRELYRELQVHECYASEGPMKLAAHLLSDSSDDCLDQVSAGAEMLCCPEPNFFILGAKSFGRNSNFLYSIGLEQIRQLFALLGDRDDLDLYSSIKSSAGTSD